MEEKGKSVPGRKRKIAAHGGHHGGSWKVAYGDMITSLMALFFLLWIVTSLDEKSKRALSAWFQDPGIFKSPEGAWILEELKQDQTGKPKPKPQPTDEPPPTRGQELTKSQQQLRALADEIRRLFSTVPKFREMKDQIRVDFVDDGMRIQIFDLDSKPLFGAGRAALSTTAQEILQEMAQRLTQIPNTIDIGGHTDAVRYGAGPKYTNWELSVDRANSVRRYITRAGLPGRRVGRVSGYAETQPYNPKDLKDPRNRRISMVVRYLLTETPRR